MANKNWPPVIVRQRMAEHAHLETLVRDFIDTDETPEREPNDPELIRAMARYLTIRSAGLVESVRDVLAVEHARQAGNSRLHRRVENTLIKGQGTAPEQLKTFMGTFDPEWKSTLGALLANNDDELGNLLGGLVAARKLIAHGDGENASGARALAWSQAAQQVCSWMIVCLEPNELASKEVEADR